MVDVEKNTPAWLQAQIKSAEKTVPMATPLSEQSLEEKLSGPPGRELAGLVLQGEVYQGEPKVEKSKPKRKKTGKKNEDATSEPQNPNGFYDIASELAEMLTNKNRKYGDSYARMAHVLPIFYPDGVPGNHLLDAVFILRIIDKLMRIASAQSDDEEDPVADIAGYAILRMREMRGN